MKTQEYERAVIFRLGRVKKGGAVGPGLFTILPCIDNIVTVDLRTVTFDVPPQEILTKDSVTVTVDAVVLFKVYNPMSSVINVANASHATRLLASTTLRNMLGTRNLHVRTTQKYSFSFLCKVQFIQDILSDRETISSTMLTLLDEATDPWGIRYSTVE